MNIEKLVERHNRWSRDQQQNKDVVKRKLETNKRRDEIMRVLKDANVDNLCENGYRYQFQCGDRIFIICDQTSRVVGDCHLNRGSEANKILADCWLMQGNEQHLYDDIRSFCDFRDICINGEPYKVIEQLLEQYKP